MFRTSVGTPPPSAMVRTRGGKETAPKCDRCHVPVCWKAQKFLTEIRERCPDDQIRCRYCEASFSVYDLENFKQHMRTEHIECLIWYSDKVTEDREDRVGCKFCEWSVEGDENDIENLYAHLQKKHPKKLRTILGDEDLVATAFNDFGTDMKRVFVKNRLFKHFPYKKSLFVFLFLFCFLHSFHNENNHQPRANLMKDLTKGEERLLY